MAIEFGPWRPDLPALGNPCLVARNVIRQAGGYRQFRSFANTITALAARVRGAYAVKTPGGSPRVYAGTDAGLFRLSTGGTSFTDVSKAGGYNCGSGERWSGVAYNDSIFMANIDDPIQAATIGSGSFADLSADAPKCRYMTTWGQHLVVANLVVSSVAWPNRVHWSGVTAGVGDPTLWPTVGSDAAAQARSDKRDLVEGGAITGLTQGEFGGLVITERKIYAAQAVESSLVFDIQPVEQNRGSRYPGSIAGVGRLVFFLADDGFWMFTGSESIPIGTQKVDNWFLSNLDQTYTPRLCSALDPLNKLYIVAFAGSGHAGGNPNRLMIFNYAPEVMEWSYVEPSSPIEFLFSALTLGYSLDGLDALGYTLDTLPFSLDSVVWKGGVPALAAFDTSHRMGFFNSSALDARLTTGDYQHAAGQRSLVTSATPIVSDVGMSVTVTPITRDRLADTPTTGTASTMNAVGECPLMSNARYHRYQTDIVGGFGHAQGIDPTYTGAGAY